MSRTIIISEEDMEKTRRSERQVLHQQVKDTELNISRTMRVNQNLGNPKNGNPQFALFEKNNNNIVEDQQKLETVKQRLLDLESGRLDSELETMILGWKTAANATKVKEKTKKVDREIKVREDVDKRETDWINNREQVTKKDLESSYRYFLKSNGLLPEYMAKNLEEMPNNKGYIWRSIWCFGTLPTEPGQPITLFEKPHRDVLWIHEYQGIGSGTTKTLTIYEKKGKNPKKVIHQSSWESHFKKVVVQEDVKDLPKLTFEDFPKLGEEAKIIQAPPRKIEEAKPRNDRPRREFEGGRFHKPFHKSQEDPPKRLLQAKMQERAKTNVAKMKAKIVEKPLKGDVKKSETPQKRQGPSRRPEKVNK